jgi:membrane associated rhomboid family serine protease
MAKGINILSGAKKISVTTALILLCFAAFIYEAYLSSYGTYAITNFINNYGLSYKNFVGGKYWTILTNMFLHGNAEHFVLNMLALFFFGHIVEDAVGRKKLLLIFLASGIFANICTLAAGAIGLMAADIPTIGASGAIFGLLGAAMILKPFEFISFPYVIPVPVVIIALLYAFYNTLSFILTLTGVQSQIAYVAHIGGIFAGIYFGFKEGGTARALKSLIIILIILFAIPFLWNFIVMFEQVNWTKIITGFLR